MLGTMLSVKGHRVSEFLIDTTNKVKLLCPEHHLMTFIWAIWDSSEYWSIQLKRDSPPVLKVILLTQEDF